MGSILEATAWPTTGGPLLKGKEASRAALPYSPEAWEAPVGRRTLQSTWSVPSRNVWSWPMELMQGHCLGLHCPKVFHLVAGPLLVYKVILCQLEKAPSLGGPLRKRCPFVGVCDLTQAGHRFLGWPWMFSDFYAQTAQTSVGLVELWTSERARMKVERRGQASVWVEGQLVFAPQSKVNCVRQQLSSFNIRHWIIQKYFDWKAGLPHSY